jgi:hypothetical protein
MGGQASSSPEIGKVRLKKNINKEKSNVLSKEKKFLIKFENNMIN